MDYAVIERYFGVTPFRSGAYAVGIVLCTELVLLPWTAHSFDMTAFFLHADRVFFAHVSPVRWWAFGSVALMCLIAAQLPVLFVPALAEAVPLRIVLAKLPSWFSDLGTAWVIRACSAETALANWWALRYLTDPAVLFATVFHGQMDAIPNLFAVAGIALMMRDRFELSALALGIGAGTKFFPAAYVPLLLVAGARRGSLRRSVLSLAIFAGVAAALLAPVMAGRFSTVADFFRTNSYGAGGDSVLLTSLWALLPKGALRPQYEQLAAVAVPVALALALLRRSALDAPAVARTALWSALAIVLLNPGAHAPFYLWIAGPLVLYCAVANDAVVSVAGIALSCLGAMIQFCQEGSDEYFLLNFGGVQHAGPLQCAAPPLALELAVLVCAAAIVVASVRPNANASFERLFRRGSIASSLVFFAFFVAAVGQSLAARASAFGSGPRPYWNVVHAPNVFTIGPSVRGLAAGGCELTYDAGDFPVFAGNPFAARYVRAFLGYTLYSPVTMIVRDRLTNLDALPGRYEHIDLIRIDGYPIRVTREFEVTDLLRPYRFVERFVERPCSLIEGNPVLYYTLDLEAARRAASEMPLLRRLEIFNTQEPMPPPSIKGPNHV